MKSLLCYTLSFCVMLCTTAVAQATPPPAEAFAQLPSLKQIRISPDGSKFSALVNNKNRYHLSVFTNTSPLRALYASSEDDKLEVNRTFWGNNDRLVFSLEFAGNRYGTETTETRLLSMNPDGTDMRSLYRLRDGEDVPQIQDRIVSRLSDDPEHILVQYGFPTTVYRVKVNQPRRHKTHQRPKTNINFWQADRNGDVRIGSGVVNEKRRKLIVKRADGKWHDISHRVAEGSGTFYIDGISDDPNIFYVVSSHESDTDALYAYDVEADNFVEKLFGHPRFDVVGSYQDPATGKALGVFYADDEGVIHWLEETMIEKHLDALNKYFDGASVTLSYINQSSTWAAVYVDEGNRPGRYHLYDMQNYTVDPLPAQYPALTGVPLGKTVPATYTARDGLEIPAYVTLPPGMETLAEAQSIPFVIHPHGGPNARDLVGFDYWVQFLATRGYGVLQMNFRGSTGYGNEFINAGDRQWGQAMQDDITDGTNWLIENGYADPERIAILGGSYGGYAALMGAAKTPDLYQCAVSFAGVTDLPQLLRDAKQYVNGKYRTRHIGNLWRDRSMLRENSPALRAADIQIPVLLVHGEKDRVVDISQGKRMRTALRRNDKDFTYIELPEGDHYLSLYANRLKFLQETEKFLQGCIS